MDQKPPRTINLSMTLKQTSGDGPNVFLRISLSSDDRAHLDQGLSVMKDRINQAINNVAYIFSSDWELKKLKSKQAGKSNAAKFLRRGREVFEKQIIVAKQSGDPRMVEKAKEQLRIFEEAVLGKKREQKAATQKRYRAKLKSSLKPKQKAPAKRPKAAKTMHKKRTRKKPGS